MASMRRIDIEPEIIHATPCEMNYACLSEENACHVEPFLDRDVQLLRCKDKRACAYRKKYLERFICTCPVNIASFRHN